VIACPLCGYKAADDFAFCPKCATALTALPSAAEERKTVTTLICDLVGFTAMSEAADPEDVDALLGEYSERARNVIESHGGTVEKFIGDAVVGVFGVPAVHEDDPERAVRAGLRLIEALEGLTRPDASPLQCRVGINTGEALVRLDVDPSSGRGFLTGDAVNVAARLQAAAPPNGVAVGALTHELTSRVIDYEELPSVAAKGKAEPVRAWRALSAVARRGSGPSGSPRVSRRRCPSIGMPWQARRLCWPRRTASARRRRPAFAGPPPRGTTSRSPTRKRRPCSGRGAACWRSHERPRQRPSCSRHARSSNGWARSRPCGKSRRCSGRGLQRRDSRRTARRPRM
jgi:class 3 adenylate cyclase